MIYDIDLEKFAHGLLPTALRGQTLKLLLGVLLKPFESLRDRFIVYKRDKEWYLNYNCTAYPDDGHGMQQMLNDYFADLKTQHNCTADIKVETQYVGNEVVLYPEGYHNPVMTPVVITNVVTWNAYPFVVRIPSVLQNHIDEGQVIRLVNIFKLYGTSFSIEYYT